MLVKEENLVVNYRDTQVVNVRKTDEATPYNKAPVTVWQPYQNHLLKKYDWYISQKFTKMKAY